MIEPMNIPLNQQHKQHDHEDNKYGTKMKPIIPSWHKYP